MFDSLRRLPTPKQWPICDGKSEAQTSSQSSVQMPALAPNTEPCSAHLSDHLSTLLAQDEGSNVSYICREYIISKFSGTYRFETVVKEPPPKQIKLIRNHRPVGVISWSSTVFLQRQAGHFHHCGANVWWCVPSRRSDQPEIWTMMPHAS